LPQGGDQPNLTSIDNGIASYAIDGSNSVRHHRNNRTLRAELAVLFQPFQLYEITVMRTNARFLRALEVVLDYGERSQIEHLLEGFSGLATELRQHLRAVRLGGAAEALREAQGAPLHPAFGRLTERRLAISREALGAEAASAAWAAGRSLPMEQALEEAGVQQERGKCVTLSW
jgi:hypothetical protein